MTALRDWYLGRTSRERWLIALMLAIAVPLLLWAAIYRPLALSLEAARERHEQAVRNHGLVLARIAQLESARRPALGGAAASSSPLALRVTEAAAQAGVSLAANEPRGPSSAVITLAPAAPTAALRWLSQLERGGILVREFSITPQGNGTVAVAATVAQGGA